MGIDDVVTEVELDVLDLSDDLEILQQLLFGDIGDGSVLLGVRQPGVASVSYVCR